MTLDSCVPVLANCLLFRDVDIHSLADILRTAQARVEEHHTGRTVRFQGDVYEDLIIVASGELVARIDDSNGRGMIVEHFRPSSLVAGAVLTSSDPVLPVSLEALEDSVLVTIPADEMYALFVREPAVLKSFLTDAGDKVRFLAEKLRLLRFGTLRRRIAGHLLGLARQQGTSEPKWRYGREQTADLLGVARPSLSRELSSMVQEGLLEHLGRDRVKLNPKALRALLDEK